MTKYESLAMLYKEDIKELKEAWELYGELRKDLEAAEKNFEKDDNPQSYEEMMRLDRGANEVYWHYGTLRTGLQHKIEDEYSAVPFSAPANRGIEKFWEIVDKAIGV